MNTNFRNYALIASAVVALAAIAGEAITGRSDLLGFGLTIVTILLAAAGLSVGQIQLGNQVSDVHEKVNGITAQLVSTTASDSFQQGQAAGPGAPIPVNPQVLEP